jgi:hypothetical protein
MRKGMNGLALQVQAGVGLPAGGRRIRTLDPFRKGSARKSNKTVSTSGFLSTGDQGFEFVSLSSRFKLDRRRHQDAFLSVGGLGGKTTVFPDPVPGLGEGRFRLLVLRRKHTIHRRAARQRRPFGPESPDCIEALAKGKAGYRQTDEQAFDLHLNAEGP